MKLALSVGLLLGLICCIESAGLRLTGQALINQINNKNLTFKVKLNKKFVGMSEEQIRRYIAPSSDSKFLIQSPKLASATKTSSKSSSNPTTAIPDSFDIADKWPQCNKVFRRIKDHGSCPMAGWALLGAAVITDRRCIVSNAKLLVPISAWDAFTCVDNWVENTIEAKCFTTMNLPDFVYQAYGTQGLVTGGTYGGFGCKTYPINDQTDPQNINLTCSKQCRKEYKTRSYANDIQKGPVYDHFIDENIPAIKQEIMDYGSVATTFGISTVDFPHYSSGVYEYTGNGADFGIAFGRITGWGIENGAAYWKVASHFGYDFGDRGFFKYTQTVSEYTSTGVQAPLVE